MPAFARPFFRSIRLRPNWFGCFRETARDTVGLRIFAQASERTLGSGPVFRQAVPDREQIVAAGAQARPAGYHRTRSENDDWAGGIDIGGGRGDDHQRDVLFPRQNSVRTSVADDTAGADADLRESPFPADLVR